MDNSDNAGLERLEKLARTQAAEINRLQKLLSQAINDNHALEAQIATYQTREARYEVGLDLMNEYAFSADVHEDGRITREWCTPSFARITGYSSDEMEAAGGFINLLHPEDRLSVQKTLAAVMRGQDVVIEKRLITQEGDVRWLRTRYRPVWDDERTRVIRFFGAGTDITEEYAIKDQQARFVTNAMHELSHPVSSILMRLYMMRKQPERLEEHLDALEPVTNHLRHMIEDMREISYLERGLIALDQQPVTLQPLLQSVVDAHRTMAQHHERQITLDMTETPVTVFADAERLKRAFDNLLSNVITTAIGDAVRLALLVEPEPPHAPLSALVRTHYQVGASKDDHPSVVFRPFHRASEGAASHTGLELSIFREIIRLHGGVVDVETEADGSRTFSTRLLLTQRI